jgi:tetratricopeptide (TPR) repeat protein/DNA-binding SARP family transcriptional activator
MLYTLTLVGFPAVIVQGPQDQLPSRLVALLCYLGMHGDPWVPRAGIAKLLWPTSSESRGRHSLSQLIYRGEQLLPQIAIERRSDAIRRPAGLTTDAELIRNGSRSDIVQHLLDIKRLEIADCPFPEGLAFRDWWDASAAELQSRLVRVAREAAIGAMELGQIDNALHLSTLLMSAGEHDQECVDVYTAAIASKDGHPAAMRAWSEVSREAASAGTIFQMPHILDRNRQSQAMANECRSSLVGRDREFRQLREHLDSLPNSKSRLIAVIGEAGIGKTRLLNQLELLATMRGVRVMVGKAHAAEQYLSYSTIADVLSNGVQKADLEKLPLQWRRALLQAVPRIGGPAEVNGDPGQSLPRSMIVEGLAVTIELIAASAPVLLRIDDFHWADQSSIEVVSYLRRRLGDSNVLIILGARPEDLVENRPALELIYGESSDGPSIITLGPLSDKDAQTLLDDWGEALAVSIEPATRAAILVQSCGRPFYILEAVRHVKQQGASMHYRFDDPERTRPVLPVQTIDNYVQTRLRRLSKDHLSVVTAVATLGRYATTDRLEGMLGVSGLPLARILSDLENDGLITSQFDNLTFTHDILSDAAYRLSLTIVRRLMHAKAASVLEQTEDVPDGTLAIHYSLAENRAAAFGRAISAAKEEAAGYGEREFFGDLSLRMSVGPEQEVLARECLLKVFLGDRRYEDALPHAQILSTYYYGLDNVLGTLLVEYVKLGAAFNRGEINVLEAIRGFEDAVLRAKSLGDVAPVVELIIEVISCAYDAGNSSVIKHWSDELLRIVIGAPKGLQVRALIAIARSTGVLGNIDDSLRYSERALTLSDGEDWETRVQALLTHAICLYYSGRIADAEIECRAALAMAANRCSGHLLARIENELAVVLIEKGEYREAATRLDHALSLGNRRDILAYAGNAAVALYGLGGYRDCRAAGEQMLEFNSRLDAPWVRYAAFALIGLAALAEGEMADATAAFDAVSEVLGIEHAPHLHDDQYVYIFICQYLNARGNRTSALEILNDALASGARRIRPSTLRLLIEKSRILKSTSPDAAWRLAKDVRDEAREHGAWAIVRMAEEILESIPHV